MDRTAEGLREWFKITAIEAMQVGRRTCPQRGRQTRVLSGIDIALWDLAGNTLNQPVSVLPCIDERDEI